MKEEPMSEISKAMYRAICALNESSGEQAEHKRNPKPGQKPTLVVPGGNR